MSAVTSTNHLAPVQTLWTLWIAVSLSATGCGPLADPSSTLAEEDQRLDESYAKLSFDVAEDEALAQCAPLRISGCFAGQIAHATDLKVNGVTFFDVEDLVDRLDEVVSVIDDRSGQPLTTSEVSFRLDDPWSNRDFADDFQIAIAGPSRLDDAVAQGTTGDFLISRLPAGDYDARIYKEFSLTVRNFKTGDKTTYCGSIHHTAKVEVKIGTVTRQIFDDFRLRIKKSSCSGASPVEIRSASPATSEGSSSAPSKPQAMTKASAQTTSLGSHALQVADLIDVGSTPSSMVLLGQDTSTAAGDYALWVGSPLAPKSGVKINLSELFPHGLPEGASGVSALRLARYSDQAAVTYLLSGSKLYVVDLLGKRIAREQELSCRHLSLNPSDISPYFLRSGVVELFASNNQVLETIYREHCSVATGERLSGMVYQTSYSYIYRAFGLMPAGGGEYLAFNRWTHTLYRLNGSLETLQFAALVLPSTNSWSGWRSATWQGKAMMVGCDGGGVCGFIQAHME